MRVLFFACLLAFFTIAHAQKFFIRRDLRLTDTALNSYLSQLAKDVIPFYTEPDRLTYYDNLLRFQLVAAYYEKAIASHDSILLISKDDKWEGAAAAGIQFRSYAATRKATRNTMLPFETVFIDTLTALYNRLPEKARPAAFSYFSGDTLIYQKKISGQLTELAAKDSIGLAEAKSLLRTYASLQVFRPVTGLSKAFFRAEERKKYIITDSLLIPAGKGAQLSAIVVRNRSVPGPQPVILMYNIYAGTQDKSNAMLAADKGYTGIVVNTRGKYNSPQMIAPFEMDGSDAYDVIDWISRQSWCNGKIGMYGGSYLGFSQWSATKKLHPALKTIVPQVAVGIGVDYPVYNGVFMTYALRWIHYVVNNKLTDRDEFMNTAKWDSLFVKWYRSGRSFRSLDTLDGRPNAIFQRWLQHPAQDAYWQSMVPYAKDFARINIPILTTTGYFDDDQRGAFYYMQEHTKWNKHADHYLLIGPFDHGGAQSAAYREVRGYTIDSAANINVNETVFQWFDHILKGGPMPLMLKDRINFQVAGTNEWRSAGSISALHNDSLVLYVSNTVTRGGYRLTPKRPAIKGSIRQEVDYTDRSDIDLVESQIVDSVLHTGEKLHFISEPLDQDLVMNGSFEGLVKVTLNKRDIDLAMELYELRPDGKYFQLSSYLTRASLTADRSRRTLLIPGKEVSIPINNSVFMSKKISRGSKIVLIMGMNKSPYWQVNYGTGKDVSDETVRDGAVPLTIEWSNQGFIKIPLLRYAK